MNSKLLDKELSLLSVSGRWSVETISQEEVVIVLSLWMRKILVIAGCAALLATMGMYTGKGEESGNNNMLFAVPHNRFNEQILPHLPVASQAPAAQSPRQSPEPSISASTEAQRMEPIAKAQHMQAARSLPSTPAIAPVIASRVAPDPASSPVTAAAPTIAVYEVTAYYLNVREQPSSESSILNVVEKGDRLDVQHRTDNGWYKLHPGGYVHGDYLQPIDGIHTSNAADAAAESTIPKKKQEVMIATATPVPVPAVLKRVPSEPKKPSSTVKVESGLTKDNIAEIFEGTALEGHDLEQAILDVEETYGINAYFTIAVMKLESGNGKSKLAKEKNNLFGLNAVGNSTKKAYSFETKADSVHKFGQLISKSYVGKGYTTIEKVARKYCPANPKWASLVKRIMNGDYKKL